ncbi:MAG: O-antigen ligase family protein [Verrucomicrobiota bacterium]
MSNIPQVRRKSESAVVSVACLVFLMAGLAWLATAGTSHEMATHWPGYLALIFAAVCSLPALGNTVRGRLWSVAVAAVVVMAGYFLWRIESSPVVYNARKDLLVLTACLIGYGLFITVFTAAKFRFAFLALIFVLMLGNLGLAIYQKFVNPEFAFMGLFIDGLVRVKHNGFPGGFFNNHNHLAGFMEVGAIFALALFFFGKLGTVARLLTLAAAVAGLAGVALSASRGGVLALMVGIACFVVLSLMMLRRFRRLVSVRLLVIASLALVVMAAASLGFAMNVLAQRTGESGLSAIINRGDIRFRNWQVTLQQVSESPIVGSGARTFENYFTRNWPLEMWQGGGYPRFSHNDYLQTAAEYGLFGLGLILLTLTLHLANGLRAALWFAGPDGPDVEVRQSKNLAILLGALGAIAAGMAHAVVDFNLRFPANALTMAFAFAVCANPGFGPSRKRLPGRVFSGVVRAFPVLAAAAMGFWAWNWSAGDYTKYRAELARESGQNAESTAFLHQTIEHDPQNPGAWKELALLRFNRSVEEEIPILQQQYMKQAVEALRKAHEVHPQDFWVHQMLADTEWVLADLALELGGDREKHLEEAEKWFITAEDWSPPEWPFLNQYSAFLRTMATEKALMGQCDASASYAKRSYETLEIGRITRHESLQRALTRILDGIRAFQAETAALCAQISGGDGDSAGASLQNSTKPGKTLPE